MNCSCNKRSDRTREELLMEISEIQFVCIELNLYINTHPQDQAALNDYYAYSRQLNMLINEYEQEFGPLYNFGNSDTETGSWALSQWPWE